MAVLLIPTGADPYYRQKTRLDGRDFILAFSYNERIQRWYLSLYDEDETPLLLGLKLMANWPLLRHYRYDIRLPPGELMALTRDGSTAPPTLDELGEGKRAQLYYREAT